jgi:hypothetical protein
MVAHQRPKTQAHTRISTWWFKVQTRLILALELIDDDSLFSPKDIEVTIAFLKKNYYLFELADYPVEAAFIREHMLAAFNNLIQSLCYRHEQNSFQSHVRYDMAQAALDNVRFHLLQIGIND